MQRLTKVGILSLAKLMGASGLLIGLLFGIIYGAFIVLFGLIGAVSGSEEAGGMLALGIGGGLLAAIGMPLFYGVMSFIFGLIYGVVINLVLSFTGGLELEIQPGGTTGG